MSGKKKLIFVLLLLLFISGLSFAKTTLASGSYHSGGFTYEIYTNASVYKNGSYCYYAADSIWIYLKKEEKAGGIANYVIIKDTAGNVYVSKADTYGNANDGTYSFTVSGTKDLIVTLYAYNWWSGVTTVLGSRTIKVRKDTTGPSASISPDLSKWYNTDTTVEIDWSDSGSGLSVTDTTDSFIATAEGTTTETFTREDKVSNETSISPSVKIDKTPPTLELCATPDDWTNESVTVAVSYATDTHSGIDSDSLRFWTGGAVTTPETSGTEIAITESGETTVYFACLDNAGNERVVERDVRIDRTPPVMEITAVPDEWTASDITISISLLYDALSGIAAGYPKVCSEGAEETPLTQGTEITISTDGITTVTFVARDKAGYEITKTASVRIDKTGPQISGEIDPFSIKTDMDERISYVITDIVDSAAGVDDGSWAYSFDGNTYSPVPFIFDDGGSILTNSLSEGAHELYIRVADTIGNESFLSRSVVIDRIAPVIETMTVTSTGTGTPIEDGDFISSSDISVELTAIDIDGVNDENIIERVQYSIVPEYPNNTEDLVWTDTFDFSFEISSLPQGPHYLFARVIDGSNNVCEPVELFFQVDQSIPRAPSILGITHPEAQAPEDAGPIRDAIFKITTTGSGSSGIEEFSFRLKKGDVEVTSGTLPNTIDPILEFLSLEDNETGEFYTLTVAAVSGSGVSGSTAEYIFRVDTKPPQHLRVHAVPFSNESVWYNAKKAMLSWQQPLDMTGVEEYYYFISDQPVSLPVTEEDRRNLSLDEWTATDKMEIEVDLLSALGVQTGIAYVVVCAQDYAGNRQFDDLSLKFDTLSPFLEPISGGDLLIDVTGDTDMFTAHIEWGTPSDDNPESGVERLVGSLHILGEGAVEDVGSPRTVQPDVASLEYSGLSLDDIYLFRLIVFDAAGNEKAYQEIFLLDGSDPPLENLSIPFSFNFDGYRVYGTRNPGSGMVEAFLSSPPSVVIEEFNEVNETWQEIPEILFDSTEFSGNDFAKGSCNTEKTLRVSVADFSFITHGLSFDPEQGLIFPQVDLSVMVINDSGAAVEEILRLTNVDLSFPPVISIEISDPVSGLDLTIQSKQITDTENRESWLFSGVSEIFIEDDYLVLRDAVLETNNLKDLAEVHLFTDDNGDRLYQVQVIDVTLLPGELIEEGSVDTTSPVFIEFGGSLVEILSADIVKNELIIHEGWLVLCPGFSQDYASIMNFAVSDEGVVRPLIDFSVEQVSFIDAYGTTYSFLAMTIIGNALVVQEGALVTVGGLESEFAGVILTSDGPDWSGTGVIPSLEFTLHGFQFSGTGGELSENSISFSEVILTSFPQAFGGGDKIIHGLAISLNSNEVLHEGTGTATFPLIYIWDGSVIAEDLIVTADGVFARRVIPRLPETVGGGEVVLPELELFADGSVGESGNLETSVPLIIRGFDIQGDSGSFNGSTIVFDSASTIVDEGDYPFHLKFSNLVIDVNGVAGSALNTGYAMYVQNGWRYNLKETALSADGIQGTADLLLPRIFGGREITFPNFRLIKDTGAETGSADGTAYIRLCGWITALEDIEITGPDLNIGAAGIILYPTMSPDTINLTDLRLSSSGQIIDSGTPDGSADFLSENGFRVVSDSYRYVDGYLRFGGKVYFPPALGENVYASYADDEIILSPDGTVETPVKAGPVTYSIAGWDVKAEEYQFIKEGLFIKYNTLMFKGFDILIDDLFFYADGSIKAGGRGFEGFNLPLFGGRFEVSEIRLTEQGLNAKSFVQLPQELGGASLYFDRLTLHPDGIVTTDVAIPEFGFNIGAVDFLFRNVRIDEDGLRIGEGIVTLSLSPEVKKIRIVDFKITNDGDFELGGLQLDPFEFLGFILHIENIGFANDIISFDGSLILPDTLPKGLAGKTMRIIDLRITTSGEILNFAVQLEGELEFELLPDWKLIIETVGIRKDAETGDFFIYVDSGRLVFPDTYNVGEVAITGIMINPVTGDFFFDAVTISDVSIDKFGLNFHLNQLSIFQSGRMEFSGSVTLPENYAGLGDLTIEVAMFEITEEGTIGRIEGSLIGLETDLLDGLRLMNGSIGFSKDEDDLYLMCSGDLQFIDPMPDGVKGKSLHLNAFRINTTTGKLEEFDASSDPLGFNLLNKLDIVDAQFHAYLNSDDIVEVAVSGDIVLPADMPEFLAGQHVGINVLRFSLDGEIKEFSGDLTLSGENELFGGIMIRDTLLGVEYDNIDEAFLFSINGTLVLSDSFPEGIAGTEFIVDKFIYDSVNGLQELDATVAIADFSLFNTLDVRNCTVHITADSQNPVIVDLAGNIILPSTFPDGLANLSIDINTFSFDLDGNILDVDAGTSDINVILFDVLGLEKGAISLNKGAGDEYFFSITGDIVLPDTLGENFSGMRLSISELLLSTKTGLVAFKAGSATPVSFDLFAGITAEFTTIDLSQNGFSFSGNITFPDSFPEGLSGMVVVLENYEMLWDGTLVDIAAGIGSVTVTPGGFTVDITNLLFHADSITLESAILTLPPNMGSKKIGLVDAGFDSEGNFYGDLVTDDIYVDLAGFTLILRTPVIDFRDQEIRFSSAGIKMPDFIGGAILVINGVKVNSSGVTFTGGAFSIPDFTVAGGLGFRDIHINFTVDEDGKYFAEGGGEAMVPGAGTFRAEVSFTNKSSQYPIGIKRAFFSYTVSGIGLPLGSTGLYLNKIRGGIAFGPPDELPREIQSMFDDGIRLQLGLTMVDQTGGRVVKGGVDVWIDITDWDWAFEGNITVLNGLVRGNVLAALTGKGFYGTFRVRLSFVKGVVKVYVYKRGRVTKVNGSGRVTFGLPRGLFVNKRIKIWPFKPFYIVIPSSTWWLGSLGAEFGTFKNGAEGFKGWVDAKAFGKIGVFVPKSGKPKFGNVSKYTLYNPWRSTTTYGVRGFMSTTGTLDTEVFKVDESAGSVFVERLNFTVPGPSKETIPEVRSFSALEAPGTEGTKAPEAEGEEIVERIVFTIAYAEGCPLVTAISPSGQRFTAGHPDVIIEYAEWGEFLVVLNPEPGEWSVEVANVLHPEAYYIEVYGTTAAPEISLETPAYDGQIANGSISVTGIANSVDGRPAEVNIYLGTESNTFLGEKIGEVIANEEGGFSFELDSTLLKDGEYYLYAGIECGDNPEMKDYAPGSLIIRNISLPLQAMEEFTVSELEDGGIEIQFTDPNGDRCEGYVLSIENFSRETADEIELGRMDRFTLSGFDPDDDLRLSVRGYAAGRKFGPRTDTITITIGGPKSTANSFNLSYLEKTIPLCIGEMHTGTVQADISFPVTTGTASDYLQGIVEELPEGVHISFENERWNASEGDMEIGYTIYVTDEIVPGTYEARIAIRNTGNNDLTKIITLTLEVTYPEVIITDILPEQWNSLHGVELVVFGESFFEGTRIYLDDEELTLIEADRYHLKAEVPAGTEAGTRMIRVTGPGEDTAEREVTVVEPSYIVLTHKTYSEVNPGGTTEFILGIEGENEFDGSAGFTIDRVPEGWQVSIDKPVIFEGEKAIVEVTTQADAALGEYTIELHSDSGSNIILYADVTESYPAPTISSLSAYTVLGGDTVTIYGYGFGEAGEVRLDEIILNQESWEQDRIEVTIPDGASSGDLIVSREGTESNPYHIYVKDSGFLIHREYKQIRLQPGEGKTINLYINGYADAVDLAVTSNEEQLYADLDRTTVIPNGTAQLLITLGGAIPNGAYEVTVTGTSGEMERTSVIEVIVGDAFAITTEILPKGMTNTTYRAEITTENGSGPIIFELSEGRMPPGLTLSSDGTLKGTPKEDGTWTITVTATDNEGRTAEGEFTIEIEENAWTHEDKGSGRNAYNDVPVTAGPMELWQSDAYTDAKQILTGDKRVYLMTDEKIIALQESTGALLYTIKGRTDEWFYASDTLYILTEGTLRAIDTDYGNERWSREGIETMTGNGSTIVADTGEGIIIIDLATGTLTAEQTDRLEAETTCIWKEGELYRIKGKSIENFTTEGWNTVYTEEYYEIVDVITSAEEFALLNENGTLRILNSGFETQVNYATAIYNGRIILAEDRILLNGENRAMSISRSTGETRYEKYTTGGITAAGAEKEIIAGNEGLTVYNGYTGKVIWELIRPHRDIALSGERLYALDEEGRVTCYKGPANMDPPETNIITTPVTPDGSNGYYITVPEVTLEAVDAETYIEETHYRVNGGEYQLYTQPFILPEGYNSITAYSIDSHGYREQEVIRSIHVDTTAPVTTANAAGEIDELGLYISPVTITVEAADEVSGVYRTEFSVNGAGWHDYYSPVTIDYDGIHTFEYRSVDNAGNTEETRSSQIRLDRANPEVTVETTIYPGMGILYLNASDACGIEKIEYTINNGAGSGEPQIYTGPLSLGEGTWTVTCQATDLNGRKSGWETITIEVDTLTNEAMIQNLEFAYPLPGREIDYDIQVGDRLYAPSQGRQNKIDSLPGYLEGTAYIRTHFSDRHWAGSRFATFTAGADIDVYILKHEKSEVSLDGWDLVEEAYPIEPGKYFRGGADIYRRTYSYGEEVVIPGSRARKGWGNLIFVKLSDRNTLRITQPVPGSTITPLSTIWYSEANILPEGTETTWSVRFQEGDWRTLSEEGTIEIPYTEDTLRMELKAEAETGGRTITVIETYKIVNKAGITLIDPAPGTELLAGSLIELDANATDMLGRQIPDEAIRWSMSRDGETWKPYEVEEEGHYRVPETPGVLYLLGTIEETAGRTREERFTFEVTEEYTPVSFDIGPELSGPAAEHPDGKTYGFTTDHSNRAGTFTAKTILPRFRRRPIVITTEETFVALKQGEAFRYASGNGRYKVILRLGPIGPIRHHTVAVEDREINIPRAFRGLDIFTVTTEIEVTDGILEIRGTRGLTIMSLEVHRLTGEDPPVEETVERQKNTIIILHPWECGWRGGSQWQDLEAWIDNDTPNGKWDW
jgi:hypothetical protein